jgi:hypothetical protein
MIQRIHALHHNSPSFTDSAGFVLNFTLRFAGANNLVLNIPFAPTDVINWHNTLVPTNALPVPIKVAYPGMIPCVLGVDTVVGHIIGGCQVDVRVWQAAPSTHLACRYGHVSDTRLRWDTKP